MNDATGYNFLFVSGIQRSGTTALANTLNWHGEIAVCIERFKKLINKNKCAQFTPELFEREALFDFSTDFTNCTPEHSDRFSMFYQNLEAKYDDLKYLGDKIANDPGQIPGIHNQFPNSKIIYIVRDIFDIACSWQTRSERETDRWPAEKTAECAVEPWNELNRQIVSMREASPEDVYVVHYSRFFDVAAESNDQLAKLMDFLKLPLDESLVEGYSRAKNLFQRNVKGKERRLNRDAESYLYNFADHNLYASVCSDVI